MLSTSTHEETVDAATVRRAANANREKRFIMKNLMQWETLGAAPPSCAPVRNGVPQFSVGAQTDIFDGYPKAEAIEIAVRVMSPELLICDEIGGQAEADMLLHTMHTGVSLIASAHAADLQTLLLRPQIRRLTEAGIFRRGILLGTGAQCGQIRGIAQLQRRSA